MTCTLTWCALCVSSSLSWLQRVPSSLSAALLLLSSTIATLPAVKVGIAPSAIGLSTVYCDNLDPRGAVRVNVMNNRKPSETVEDYTCLRIIPQGYL